MPSVDVAGFTVEYETYGDRDSPPVFMVHSLYFDHVAMVTLARRLADDYFAVAHDALGHGQSDKPRRLALADQAAVLLGLIERFGGRRNAVLGEGMGSYIAMAAAALEPRRVARLILVAPKASGEAASSVEYFARAGIDAARLTPAERVHALDPVLYAPDTMPERRAQIEADILPDFEFEREEAAAVEASLAGFDLRPDLSRIAARTLVLSGRYDGLNPPAAGREVADLIPHARFELFEHSAHLLKYEEQVKAGDLIREFLDE